MYFVWRAADAIRTLADRQRGDGSLPLAKYVVLTFVRDRTDMTSADLARIIGNSPQTTNETITSLEKAGLIERRTNTTNRKSKFVTITERGIHALAQTEKAMDQIEQQAFAALDANELSALRSALKSIIDSAR
jgi:DNA-binding MarR family transcriptional regulator